MTRREFVVFAFLIGIGSLQLAGELLGMPRLKAFGAATQVAPAMKVFTAHQGYETHAARFYVGWRDARGELHEHALTPTLYAQLRGPYNRRNVYGAALAYGPLLRTDPKLLAMQTSVLRHAFCAPATLRGPLAIPADAGQIRVRIDPIRPTRTDLEFTWEIDCAR
jgi:hypothetical protein